MRERYVSVDVETAGPVPGEFSLLSIGACDVDRPDLTFYCLLQPTAPKSDPEALAVSKLSVEALCREGLPPQEAMKSFADWLSAIRQSDEELVFVGFNAAFDWSFINYYFHCYLGANPFGFSALDIKSYYMGTRRCGWSDTRSSRMSSVLHPQGAPNHNSREDAQYQAELFRLARSLRDEDFPKDGAGA